MFTKDIHGIIRENKVIQAPLCYQCYLFRSLPSRFPNIFFYSDFRLLFTSSEWLYSTAHRCQEEPDGDRHHAAGVRSRYKRRHAAGHQSSAPGSTGGQCGHGDAAARPRSCRQSGKQGETGAHLLYEAVLVDYYCI